jgi:hypothetical protein
MLDQVSRIGLTADQIPATIITTIPILASQLGKVPVMINWAIALSMIYTLVSGTR